MTDVTVVIGDKSTYQTLDVDSGLGELNPDRIYVPLTGDFSPGDLVWVFDDNSSEIGTIQAIVANDYLDMTVNLTNLYEVAENARVVLLHVISNDVYDVDTWRDRVTAIGSCKIGLSNSTHAWSNTFASNDLIVISISGTVLWIGFVDDVKPFIPVTGVMTNKLIITGRDHGRRQVDLSFTRRFPTGWAADFVTQIMTDLGDPYAYTDDGQYGGEVQIKYEAIRTNLGDALREICELSGRDYYIDNNGRLWLFEAGSIDSTADLDLVADSAANNILTFEEYEQVGTTIKNYVEIHAGSVKDHYTNQGAYLFTDAAGATTIDAIHIDYFGGSCLRIDFTAASRSYLDFGAGGVPPGVASYSPSVDLRKSCEAKVRIKGETAVDYFDLQPYAYDTTGRKILFTRDGPNILSGKGSSKGWTERIQDFNDYNHWVTLSYPLGASTGNPTKATQTTGYWHADGWDPTIADFDWEHVERLGFEWPQADVGYVLLDAWSIPSLEAHAISQNAGSIAVNDLRMDSEYRKELKSQLQLEEYAAAMVLLRKNAIQKFKCLTKGEVKTLYAAQWVHVNVPSYGLNDVEYTINVLHHKLHDTQTIRGWDFVTEYELAEQDTPGYRVIVDSNPMAALMAKIRRENRGFKGGMEADDILLGDVISGDPTNDTRGATFPTAPANGDLHWLTADYDDVVYTGFQYYGVAAGILYTYDESIPKWIRPPRYLGRRAADPPAGGGGGEYAGDTYFNTTNDITYQWDGAAWSQVSSLDIADAPDFGTIEWPTDQLAIEVRPWTSNFSITWDEADYNDVDWGIIGNEGAGDATIRYADGVSVDVDFGTAVNLADGEWYFYWDTANMAAGDYVLQRTQVYSTASGTGKGLMAIGIIDNATPEAPTFIMLNSYTPVIGAGAITANAIWSKHISADYITGKNFRTAAGTSWADGAGGVGVIFQTAGIKGKGAGGVTQFFLDSADGKVYAAAGTVILDVNGIIINGEVLEVQFGGAARGTIRGTGPATEFRAANGINAGLTNFGGTAYIIAQNGGDTLIQAGAGNVLRLNTGAGGNVEFAQHAYPSIDSTFDLGEDVTPLRFRNVYADDLYGIIHDVHGAALHTDITRELFIPATSGHVEGGSRTFLTTYGTVEGAAAGTHEPYIMCTMKVPDDFVSFTSIEAVWVSPAAAGNMYWGLYAYYGASGQSYITHNDVPVDGNTATGGAWIINVQEPANPLTLVNLASGDYIGINMDRDADDVSDTLNAAIFVLGFLFTYTANQ